MENTFFFGKADLFVLLYMLSQPQLFYTKNEHFSKQKVRKKADQYIYLSIIFAIEKIVQL